jgi:hypothetical protein
MAEGFSDSDAGAVQDRTNQPRGIRRPGSLICINKLRWVARADREPTLPDMTNSRYGSR